MWCTSLKPYLFHVLQVVNGCSTPQTPVAAMAVWRCAFVAALIASAGFAHAQTQDKAENAGTAAAVSESKKLMVPAGGNPIGTT